MNAKRVVLAGGSGFLGQELAKHLIGRGYEVVVLTRAKGHEMKSIRFVQWDGKTVGDWVSQLEGAEAVVNLAGKSVNCRYTPQNRREINASRVDSVKAVEEGLKRCGEPPRVWVQAGSLAIYGDAGDRVCDENAPPGEGFPVETCKLWEDTFYAAQSRARRVFLRIGFALGVKGGALEPLTNLTKWFLGGTVGNGRQYISWLHIADLNRMFEWAIEKTSMTGVYNATGPCPVTNAEFMRALRHALHRPWSPPTPEWAVHIGARLMGTESCLALTGRRCIPKRFLESKFEFHFPDLKEALKNLLTERQE